MRPSMPAWPRFALVAVGLAGATVAPAALAQDDTVASSGSDHLVVVLDGSGSMRERFGKQGTRMDAAAQALQVVLSELPDGTQVGIYAFASGLRDPWIYPLGPLDRARLQQMRVPAPGGQTPLGKAIRVGGDRLLAAREANRGYGTYRLLVVTDGAATDPDVLTRIAPDVAARGINLDVIGVAMEQQHVLKDYAHSYRSADDPTRLLQTVREAIGEVALGDEAEVARAFAAIDGLPDVFSMALVESLSAVNTQNHPLGSPAPPRASPPPPEPPSAAPIVPADPGPGPAPDPAACASQSGPPWSAALVALAVVGLRRRARR